MTVRDIYQIIDEAAPFAAQEPYDNAGLLVGSMEQTVHHVLLTLDITIPVVQEAAISGADLILSHHPVIWTPLKSIAPTHPVWHLVYHNIAAICAHTNFDIAAEGLNTVIGRKMQTKLGFSASWEPLELLSDGRTLGFCADLAASYTAADLAQHLAAVFTDNALRFYDSGEKIRKIAWCSGSGGDLIPAAIACGADALITGDCKHSVWADAQNRAFTLFDCGHFETEVPAVAAFDALLREKLPSLQITQSKFGTMPFFRSFR